MYIKPELEIIELSDDVILTSNGLGDGGEYELPEDGEEFWG